MADNMTFESAMDRLNEISKTMENPDITLNNAVELYSEAKKLVDFCNKSIAEAKLQLEKIEA